MATITSDADCMATRQRSWPIHVGIIGSWWTLMRCELPLFLEPDDAPELLLLYLVRLLPPEFHRRQLLLAVVLRARIRRRQATRPSVLLEPREAHRPRVRELGGLGERRGRMEGHRPCGVPCGAAKLYGGTDLGEGITDPVRGSRNGIYIGETIDVPITMPTQDWEQHVREPEAKSRGASRVRVYASRTPAELEAQQGSGAVLYYLERIGDDRDGFYRPMTIAMWHWARSHPSTEDGDFKAALRAVVRAAKCTKQRDVDAYLSDYRLDASLRGSREKQPHMAHRRGLSRPFLGR